MTPIDPAILAKFVETFRSPPDEELTFVDKVARGHLRMGFADGYQLCAAEKQAEIDALTARIATLEQQRQQDRPDVERYHWLRDKSEPGIGAFYLSVGQAFKGVRFKRETVDEAIDAARAKEPNHD